MISFDNTEIAFRSKNKTDLQRAYLLFKIIGWPRLVKLAKVATPIALQIKLPIEGLIKKTIFKQFCGGESISDCQTAIQNLGKFKIGTILDYSVEGKTQDDDFEATADIIIETIIRATKDSNIPFAVFKMTGIARHDLIELASDRIRAQRKGQELAPLTATQEQEFAAIHKRLDRICKAAHDNDVSLFIDAEETWIQTAIDQWTFDMMLRYNKESDIVFNTIQMYRHDRLAFLKSELERAKAAQITYGVKLVRGAYMEKERARALELGYPSPIQPDKAATDRDYNAALKLIVANQDVFTVCAGTHNEDSALLLTQLMQEAGIENGSTNHYFAQLLGMSDHISYNLADAGYMVAKYVPFGPVKEVLPYLLRRADENTSVAGQTSRELSLLIKEKARRARAKA
jgi:proline dehydrogenase